MKHYPLILLPLLLLGACTSTKLLTVPCPVSQPIPPSLAVPPRSPQAMIDLQTYLDGLSKPVPKTQPN